MGSKRESFIRKEKIRTKNGFTERERERALSEEKERAVQKKKERAYNKGVG